MSSTLLTILIGAILASELPDQMNAIVIREYGPADKVLKLETMPRPTCGNGELLIRVHAAGVNPIDWKIRSGSPRMAKFPYIPGFDLSGVVEQVGPGVT